MAKLIGYLWRAALISAGAIAAWRLALWLGPWLGLAAWLGVAAVFSALGAGLLATSPLGRVNWHNRLAAYLLPWGFKLGRGKLGPSAVAGTAIWLAIGAGAILLWGRMGGSTSTTWPPPPMPHPIQSPLLFSIWVIYGAIIVRQLGIMSTAFRLNPRGQRIQLKLILVLVGLIAASAFLWVDRRTGLALLLSGLPLAAVAGWFGLYLGIALTAGRQARWN